MAYCRPGWELQKRRDEGKSKLAGNDCDTKAGGTSVHKKLVVVPRVIAHWP